MSQEERAQSHKCKVLIADDSLPIRHAIREALRLFDDIEIVGEAGDGTQAVELASSCRPDVILMDLNMPVMNGIEAARVIKSSHREVSIIGLCGIRDGYTIDAFRLAGASTTMSKNRLNQLLQTIQRVCCHQAHGRSGPAGG